VRRIVLLSTLTPGRCFTLVEPPSEFEEDDRAERVVGSRSILTPEVAWKILTVEGGQAECEHAIGESKSRRKLPEAKSVPAPVIARGKLAFETFALPAGFDLRDHAARVEAFGRAFVPSVTGSLAGYRGGPPWVAKRLGDPRARPARNATIDPPPAANRPRRASWGC